MSDTVHISGIDFGGDIPEWATSKTQDALLKEAKKYHKESSATFKALKKLLEDYNKLYQQNTRDQKKANSGGSDLAKSNKILADKITSLQSDIKSLGAMNTGGSSKKGGGKSSNGGLNDVVDDLEAKSPSGKLLEKGGKVLEKYTTPTTAAGKAATELGGAFGNLGRGIVGGVIVAFEFLYDQMMATSRAYSSIYSTGAVLGTTMDGMITGQKDLIAAQVSSGVAIDKYTDIIKKHGAVVSRVGIKGFSAMGNTMSNAAMSFGMSAEQGTEYMADYLEQQKIAGIFENQSNEQTAAAAAEQLKSTMLFSRALGISREEIEEARKKELQNKTFQSALAGLPEEMRANFLKVAPQFQAMLGKLDRTAQQYSLALMANDVTTATELRGEMIAAGQGDLAETLSNVVSGIKDSSVNIGNINESSKKVLGSVDKTVAAAQRNQKIYAATHKDVYNEMASIGLPATEMEKTFNKNFDKNTEDIGAGTAPKIDAAVQTIKSAFSAGFGAILSDHKFTEALQKLSDNFKQYGPQLATAIVNFATKAVPAITKFVDWINTLFDNVDGKVEFNWGKLIADVLINPLSLSIAAWLASGTSIGAMVLGFLGDAAVTFMTGVLAPLAAPAAIMAAIVATTYAVIEGLKGMFDGFFEGLSEWNSDDIVGSIGNMAEKTILGFFTGIYGVFSKLAETIDGLVSGLINKLAFWRTGEEHKKAASEDAEREKDYYAASRKSMGIDDDRTMWSSVFGGAKAGDVAPIPKEKPPTRTEATKSDEAKDTPASQNQSSASTTDQDAGIDTAAASNAINSGDSVKILTEMLKVNEQMVRYLRDIQKHTRTTADSTA